MFRVLMVFSFVLLLTACDSSRDKAAILALSEARTQERMLPPDQAIARYQAIIDAYPQTQHATEAQAAIVQVKVRIFKQNTGLVLERVSTVLNGYQAFTGRLPQGLEQLDSGEYMFDSNYLAEIIPDGSALYLQLGKDGSTTRMWYQLAGEAFVLSRTLLSPQLDTLKAEELQALKAKWQEVAKVGRLTQISL